MTDQKVSYHMILRYPYMIVVGCT